MTVFAPTPQDASGVWDLVRSTPPLDANSPYCYLLLCSEFRDTCVVARENGNVVGCVTGMRLPHRPEVLFVWQVAVAPQARRRGLAQKMIREILSRPGNTNVRFIETTVSPSNVASRQMFRALAADLGTHWEVAGGYSKSLFPNGDHEEEVRFRIGPFQAAAHPSEVIHEHH